jgi:hypothetical protein
MKYIYAKSGLTGLSCLLFGFCCSLSANAQTWSPRAEVKLTYGLYGYDEDAFNALGGAFAYYPSPQTSGEVELLGLFNHDKSKIVYRGLALTPSFGADFRKNPTTFQPFGRLAETVDWLSGGKGSGTKTNANFTVRIGFRVYIGGRFFFSPEMGLGEHLNLKFTVSAGYVTAFQQLRMP